MTVLDDIVAGVRQDLAVREQATPPTWVRAGRGDPVPRGRPTAPTAR